MSQHDQVTYLKSLGIPLWVPREFHHQTERPKQCQALPVAKDDVPVIKLAELPGDTAMLGWQELRQMVLECTACGLHAGRTQPVFGTGSQSARLMVIGEAPGAEEDQQGEPFVGRAGQLLDQMLLAIQHPRASVYIANIVKCRPPDNRNPHNDEASQCAGYLHRQIALISPKVILAVGKVAAQNLLKTNLPIGKMRGNQYHYAALNIPVIVTYHPAYLLRSPKEKARAWQDLKLVRSLLRNR